MSVCFVYITAEHVAEARTISRTLVEERLAACANILEGRLSVYRWKGEIQEEREAVILIKTRQDLVEALTERVRALHSYETPCVVSMPINGGNDAFVEWIHAETTSDL
jgi:periplasmic divalent cation tolerance protein